MSRTPILKPKEMRALIAEEARRNLPVHVYLAMLDQAARTGKMPVLDDKGRPTGTATDLKPAERLAVTQYLIDKVLPDVPKEVYHIGAASAAADETPIDKLGGANTDTLKRIAAGLQVIAQDAEFEAGQ